MIKAIINGIMKLIMSLVSLLLSPIDALIEQFLPDLSNALDGLTSFFCYVTQYIGWVIDFAGIPSSVITLIVAYYTFKLTVPLVVSTVKLALKWYNTLKL